MDSVNREAVDAGREALQGPVRFPWYDPQRDGLRRVDVQPPADSAIHRRSTWQAEWTTDASPTDDHPSASGLQTVFEVLLWASVLGLLAWLTYLLVRYYLKQRAGDATDEPVAENRQVQDDVIENLPFDIARPPADLLGEARRLYETGAYGPALVYLFSYQLVQLDRSQAIRLERGKTNRQYLRELRHRPELRGLFEPTMIAFEQVFFGHYRLDRAGFERCWERLDQFQRRLSESLRTNG